MIINDLKKILLDVNVSLTELAAALSKRLTIYLTNSAMKQYLTEKC